MKMMLQETPPIFIRLGYCGVSSTCPNLWMWNLSFATSTHPHGSEGIRRPDFPRMFFFQRPAVACQEQLE